MAAPAIGVFLPTMTDRDDAPPDVVAAARHAEDLGFESAWVVDQLIAGYRRPVGRQHRRARRRRRRDVAHPARVRRHDRAAAARRLGRQAGRCAAVRVGEPPRAGCRRRRRPPRPLVGRGRRPPPRAGPAHRRRARACCPTWSRASAVELDGTTVQLSPGVPVPPIVVGGMADAALVRVATYGDGWFALPLPPTQLDGPGRPAGRAGGGAQPPRPRHHAQRDGGHRRRPVAPRSRRPGPRAERSRRHVRHARRRGPRHPRDRRCRGGRGPDPRARRPSAPNASS